MKIAKGLLDPRNLTLGRLGKGKSPLLGRIRNEAKSDPKDDMTSTPDPPTDCDFADLDVLGAEATADFCYAHQSFKCWDAAH